jgi:hypothetical protein
VIGTLAATVLDVAKAGHAIFEHYTLMQTFNHCCIDIAHNADHILSFNLAAGVHEFIGQITIGGEQE